MILEYAVERLFDSGWSAQDELDLERLPDGRPYPSALAVQREFARAGLELGSPPGQRGRLERRPCAAPALGGGLRRCRNRGYGNRRNLESIQAEGGDPLSNGDR